MNEFISGPIFKILIAVLGGLILFLITAYINKRKLFIVVPKSFSHTTLADKGTAYMLSLYNRGVKTEEKVLVQLNRDREYSLLATTDTSIKVHDNEISVDRINPGDELNVVLMVEGGDFSHDSIIKISSDACKGSIIDAPEKVPLTVGNAIGSSFLLLFFILGLPVLGGYIGFQFGKDGMDSPFQITTVNKVPERFTALQWDGMENFIKSKYYLEDKAREFPIKIIEKKDLKHSALVVFEFKNDGDKRLQFTAQLLSAADEPSGPTTKIGEYYKMNLFVFPGESKTVSLKVNKPDSIKNKTVVLDVNFKYKNTYTNNLEKEFWIE